MIVAIGIDVVEIARIKKAMEKEGFTDRILTPAEREYCTTIERIAGRWAVKEAVAKAMPIKITWRDVEVLNYDSGAPYVRFSENVAIKPNWRVHVSISHEKEYAAAVAVLEEDAPQIV